MNIRVISCSVFRNDLRELARSSPHALEIEWLPMGLHVSSAESLHAELSMAVERAAAFKPDAIIVFYALCNLGIVGLKAPAGIPLIVPRAHDCIALYFGGMERYRHYFEAHPATYFKTAGWVEGSALINEVPQISPERMFGMDMSYEELVCEYGEDNAAYLHMQLQLYRTKYDDLVYLRTGNGTDADCEQSARKDAAEEGMRFVPLGADLTVLQALAHGAWQREDILTVPPGGRIVRRYDDRLIDWEMDHDET